MLRVLSLRGSNVSPVVFSYPANPTPPIPADAPEAAHRSAVSRGFRLCRVRV